MTTNETRILQKLDELAAGLADVRVAIAKLEERASRCDENTKVKTVARDGGLTALGGAIGAAISAVVGASK